MTRRLLIAAAALCFAAAGCSDTGEVATTAPPLTSTSRPDSVAPTSSSAVVTTTSTVAPTTTAPEAQLTLDGHIEWFLAVLNGAAVDEDEYTARFDDAFRTLVPYAAFLSPVAQLPGPWTAIAIDRNETGTEAQVLIENQEGLRLNVALAVGLDPTGRLGGLLLTPAELEDPPDSLDDLKAQWDALAPSAALLIADVTDGTCPADASPEVLPVGSAFKLWVLGALAEAIEAGIVGWDDPIIVRDDLKSLPSGILQEEEPGTELTVREMATLMIAISDNTATDHLIDLVGRDAVEAAMALMGHSSPEANRPFLTTREAFQLKIAGDDAIRAAYKEGDEAERRAILDGLTVDLSSVDVSQVPFGVFDPGTIEWFASVGDLCRALVWLRDAAMEPDLAPLRDVLGENPGINVDRTTWPWLGFKGGSEPGVLSLSWIAERADGAVYVVSGILFNEAGGTDQITPALLLGHAFVLVGE